jgi:hypothetical protein
LKELKKEGREREGKGGKRGGTRIITRKKTKEERNS